METINIHALQERLKKEARLALAPSVGSGSVPTSELFQKTKEMVMALYADYPHVLRFVIQSNANVVTLGLAAPIVGLISWGSGQAVKTCLRAYRTHTSPPQKEINAAVKTLKQCQQDVKKDGTKDINAPLTLPALKREIFHTMDLNLSDDKKTDKSIDKFTKNSNTFRLNTTEESTKFEKAVAVGKAALLLVT